MGADKIEPKDEKVAQRLHSRLLIRGLYLRENFSKGTDTNPLTFHTYFTPPLKGAANKNDIVSRNKIPRSDLDNYIDEVAHAFWNVILCEPSKYMSLEVITLSEEKEIEGKICYFIGAERKAPKELDALYSEIKKDENHINLIKEAIISILKDLDPKEEKEKEEKALIQSLLDFLEEIVYSLKSELKPEHDKAGTRFKSILQPKDDKAGIRGVIQKLLSILRKYKMYIVIISMVAVSIPAYYVIPFSYGSSPADKPKNSTELKKEFLESMPLNYPKQPSETFKSYSKLIHITENSSRSDDFINVYTLLHKESHKTAHNMARDMAQYATDLFRKKNIYELYADNLGDDFNKTDARARLKKSLEESGAMIVYNFEKIPSHFARDFHAICDKHSPYVLSKLVIFLVFNIKKEELDHELKFKELKILARSEMEKLWEDIEKSSLDALITRLTDMVVQIK